MAPILGIYASQISGHLWAPSGSYDSIATTTVGAGGASTVTFSSIPSTYTHLQVRGIARTNRASNLDGIKVNFNSDTGSNYGLHLVYGDGTNVGAEGYGSQSLGYIGNVASASQNANVFGAMVFDILDYANTSKNKTVRSLCGDDNNNSVTYGYISLTSSLWVNTNAITTMTLAPTNGTAFTQYTQFALYGIKGA